MYKMKNGFVTLVGILIVLLLIGFWFANMYTKKNANQKTQLETYNEAIDEAKNIKNVLEDKYK